ncbi:MAG: glutamate mutase L, partial [Candidatus Cloacimonadaceae bacterium]|nr:glutamate mutase L [Candidatus Cloacimonadaceae bacterium]
MKDSTQICITDIGSTTTKAILICSAGESYTIEGIAHSPTTVEKPYADVKIGIENSIRELEQKTGRQIMNPGSKSDSLSFTPNTLFLST